MKPKVLIVDDDEEIRTQMKWAVSGDYDVTMAGNRKTAIEAYRAERHDAVLLDLGLPPNPNDTTEGMAILAALQVLDRSSKVIIVSGQSDRENAVRAIGAGAYDFLFKPVDVAQLKILLQRCLFVSEMEREHQELQDSERADVFEGMLGSSEPMREVFNMIEKVAKSSAPVLILGESGTGKEMVANAIHNRSKRKKGSFVAINCNAIPENLIESELFGYEKGAFTGANSQRIGLIETADGGTLFLDEIGELPAPVQVKLLRFLQEKKIQRVGGREEIEVDTRILAATHVDLKAAVDEGSFREDLYFRLAVVVCHLPALRQRGADIGLLARDFLQRFAAQDKREGLMFDQRAERAISTHPWPGNVRELQNRVHRAVIMADGRKITCEDLEISAADSLTGVESAAIGASKVDVSHATDLKEARETLERELVTNALQRSGGNISAAAKELGVSRPTFYELMSKLGISRD